MKILDIIKEATKEYLNEDTLKTIEQGFTAEVDQLVSEKVAAAVQVALDRQDNEHASALQSLVEKLDSDRARKLQLALETMESDHIDKLIQIKESYEKLLKKQSTVLRDELRVQISKYLDLQLEKAMPAKQLQEAAKETFARNILSEARKLFAINDIYENEVVVEAVKDGVSRIKQLEEQVVGLQKKNQVISEQAEKTKATLLVNEKVNSLPEFKAAYLTNFFNSKSESYIKENFDYVASLYDQEENDRRQVVSEHAKELRRRSNVDRLVTEKRSDEAENLNSFTPDKENGSAVLSYISELKRNDSKRYGSVQE